MKRHGNLFEKIITFENLLLASKNAIRGKKGKKAVASFYFHLENELLSLQSELASGEYRPRPYVQFEVREPKVRQICSSDFRDRVVHHAVCNFMEPIFETKSIYDSYACRRDKGAHLAVSRCQGFTRKYKYFLKCDIRKFFESIDHEILKSLLQRTLKDQRLLSLLSIIIDHRVEGNELGRGLPIGNLTSQHFANFYLGQLDHFLKDRLRVPGYLRYMDDFISFSNDKAVLHKVLEEIEQFTDKQLKLRLKDKVTLIAPVSEGVPFLGFRIFPGLIRIKRENLVRMRRKIHKKEQLYLRGRVSEKSLVQSVNSIVGHVAHVNSLGERRRIFEKSLKLA
jgi:retron-type reverse transcriptase